jgi:TIR domain-containing protein
MSAANNPCSSVSYQWDSFISYSRLDDGSPSGAPGWVSRFCGEFEDLLTKRLGRKALIWRDIGQINGQRLFDPAIQTALEQSAVLIVLYSAAYGSSDYCGKEREWFARSGAIVGDQSRILPIRLVNIPRDTWPKEFSGFTGFDFFRASESDPVGFPLDPGSRQFCEELKKVVVAVQSVLTALKKPREEAAPNERRDVAPVEIVGLRPPVISASPGSLGRVTAGDSPEEAREFELLKKAFKVDFQRCVGQISLLTARKDVHDQLHELQLKFFRPLDELLPRNSLTIDAQTLGIIHEYSFTLSDILNNLREIADRKVLPDEDIKWLNDVFTAKNRLEAAMLKSDVAALRAVVNLVDRVLAQWPSRINTKLNETARSLALDYLAAKLEGLCTASPDFDQKLGDNVKELRDLHLRISELVTVHDNWQTFDDEMRGLKATLNASLTDIADEWPGLKEKARTLKAENPDTWAQRLTYVGGEMERGLQTRDVERVQQSFRFLQNATWDRFFVVDKNLKKGCQALEQARRPIEMVLSLA